MELEVKFQIPPINQLKTMDSLKSAGRYAFAGFLSIFFGGRIEKLIPPFLVTFVGSSFYFGTVKNRYVWISSAAAAIVTRMFQRRRFITSMHHIWGPETPDLCLEPWTENWKLQVDAERERLNKFVKKYDHLIEKSLTPGISHMGSTAINGIILAKPYHDLTLAVNINPLPVEFISDLEAFGYVCIGSSPHDVDYDNWFMSFPKTKEVIEKFGKGYGIHVVMPGGHEQVKTMLNFVEYMNCHPEDVELYGNTKKKILQSGTTSIGTYSMQKATVVNELLSKSIVWSKNK